MTIAPLSRMERISNRASMLAIFRRKADPRLNGSRRIVGSKRFAFHMNRAAGDLVIAKYGLGQLGPPRPHQAAKPNHFHRH